MGSTPASVPEFPLIIAIALVLTSTTAGIFFYKKKRIPSLCGE